MILEESHAKNATLQEKLARQEQELVLLRDTRGNKELTMETTETQQETDIEMNENTVQDLQTADGRSTLLDRDPTKEPSSSTDVSTTSIR